MNQLVLHVLHKYFLDPQKTVHSRPRTRRLVGKRPDKHQKDAHSARVSCARSRMRLESSANRTQQWGRCAASASEHFGSRAVSTTATQRQRHGGDRAAPQGSAWKSASNQRDGQMVTSQEPIKTHLGFLQSRRSRRLLADHSRCVFVSAGSTPQIHDIVLVMVLQDEPMILHRNEPR